MVIFCVLYLQTWVLQENGFDPSEDEEFLEKLTNAVAIRDAYAETAGMASKLCKPKGGRRSANKAIQVMDSILIAQNPIANQSSDMTIYIISNRNNIKTVDGKYGIFRKPLRPRFGFEI